MCTGGQETLDGCLPIPSLIVCRLAVYEQSRRRTNPLRPPGSTALIYNRFFLGLPYAASGVHTSVGVACKRKCRCVTRLLRSA